MIEINLLPKEFHKRSINLNLGKAGYYGIAGAAAIAVLLVSITFYQAHQLSELDTNIKRAQQRASMLQKEVLLVDALMEVKTKFGERMEAVGMLDAHRSSWVKVLEDINRNVPEFIWLARLTEETPEAAAPAKKPNQPASPNRKTAGAKAESAATKPADIPLVRKVELEGYAFTLNALASFMINMMRSDYFEDVELVSTNEMTFDKHKAYNFVMSCNLHFLSDEQLQNMIAQAKTDNKAKGTRTGHRKLN